MVARNAFYAQSGGVTAVINASAAGLIEAARKQKGKIGKIYAGRNGIIGALTEDLIDTSKDSIAAIRACSLRVPSLLCTVILCTMFSAMMMASSTTTPMAGPWLSPNVVMLRMRPNRLPGTVPPVLSLPA